MEASQWVQPLVTALASKIVLALLAFLASAVFGVYIKDRHKFAGRWDLVIKWTEEHAELLLGKKMPEPHSCGRLAVAYGSGPDGKGYWGLAYFELLSGLDVYAKLCVELADMEVTRRPFSRSFPYLFRAELKELKLRSLIRRKEKRFEYGPWSLYSMEFDKSSGHTLKGRMVLVDSGITVGRIDAVRTG